jgi:hypothetical protein
MGGDESHDIAGPCSARLPREHKTVALPHPSTADIGAAFFHMPFIDDADMPSTQPQRPQQFVEYRHDSSVRLTA